MVVGGFCRDGGIIEVSWKNGAAKASRCKANERRRCVPGKYCSKMTRQTMEATDRFINQRKNKLVVVAQCCYISQLIR